MQIFWSNPSAAICWLLPCVLLNAQQGWVSNCPQGRKLSSHTWGGTLCGGSVPHSRFLTLEKEQIRSADSSKRSWFYLDWATVWNNLERSPLSERGRRFYHWRGPGVTQRAVRSFPGRLSAAQQSLGRGCLQTVCATQTLPARGATTIMQRQKQVVAKGFQSYQPTKTSANETSECFPFHMCTSYPFLR